MSTINPQDLISYFRYAIEKDWGYIYGTAGVMWTEAKQKAATREQTVKYGAQWIGHYVADCSGLFTWAFKQLGGYMYHGSNTMYRQYCTAKGKLNSGKRSDGKELLPGTAVFTGTEDNHGHVGLYVGDGKVIEAAGTRQGVIESKVTAAKWTYWGELKGVDYGAEPGPEPQPEPQPEKGTAIVTGKRVALRYGPTKSAGIITRVNTGEVVKITPPPEDWEYVTYNGKTGYMMKEFLKEG